VRILLLLLESSKGCERIDPRTIQERPLGWTECAGWPDRTGRPGWDHRALELSRLIAGAGHDVTVLGNVVPCEHDGVRHVDAAGFLPMPDRVIGVEHTPRQWRWPCPRILWTDRLDHDGEEEVLDGVSALVVPSKHHREVLSGRGRLARRLYVIPPKLDIIGDGPTRDRLVYASSPDDGLVRLLRIWPEPFRSMSWMSSQRFVELTRASDLLVCFGSGPTTLRAVRSDVPVVVWSPLNEGTPDLGSNESLVEWKAGLVDRLLSDAPPAAIYSVLRQGLDDPIVRRARLAAASDPRDGAAEAVAFIQRLVERRRKRSPTGEPVPSLVDAARIGQ
jgi:hypothetical protein